MTKDIDSAPGGSLGGFNRVGKASVNTSGGPVYSLEPDAVKIHKEMTPAQLRDWVEKQTRHDWEKSKHLGMIDPTTTSNDLKSLLTSQRRPGDALPSYQDFVVKSDDPRKRPPFVAKVPEQSKTYELLMNEAQRQGWAPGSIPERPPESVMSARQYYAPQFYDWLGKPFVIEKPHRCAHQAIRECGLAVTNLEEGTTRSVPVTDQLQVIQVEHDWGALLGRAEVTGEGGQWAIPYDGQVFEYAISGAAVIAAVFAADGPHSTVADPCMSMVIRLPGTKVWCRDNNVIALGADGWRVVTPLAPNDDGKSLDKIYDFMFKQIRALCIMLEAEVARTSPVRAPYNGAAPASGRPLPKLGHSIVDLARKPRADRPEVTVPTGRHHRLHFRRGHWRHYSNHRTWIKWTLVGNPDLGFVDKDYRA